MKKSLIIYSTTDNHTKKICDYIRSIIIKKYDVTLVPINEINNLNLKFYDLIIIGASIRYGKHKKEIYNFINKNLNILNTKKSAFFSVNVVARKKGKNTPLNNPYIIKFLNKTDWRPEYLDVFAGTIIYLKYKLIDKIMIKLIMWITDGPTDTTKEHEFTDWSKVEIFAKKLLK